MRIKMLSVILIFTILFSTNMFYSTAEQISTEKENISAEIKNAKFKDDSVIVVFKSEKSDINRIVTEKDFPEIKCKAIRDLSKSTREFIAEKKAEKIEVLVHLQPHKVRLA